MYDRRPSIVAPCDDQIQISEVDDDLFKVSKAVCKTDLSIEDKLSGPACLYNDSISSCESLPLVCPYTDKEVEQVAEPEPLVSVNKSNVKPAVVSSVKRFLKFSCWSRFVKAVALLKYISQSFMQNNKCCSGWRMCNQKKSPDQLEDAADLIIRIYLSYYFLSDIAKLKNEICLSPTSAIEYLFSYLDHKGLLRVEGRQSQSSDILGKSTKPVITPKEYLLAFLLIHHYHGTVHHQGREITEGAIRTAGFWNLGEKRTISKVVLQYVISKGAQEKVCVQKMGDLPTDRMDPSLPYTCVRVDPFGPWYISIFAYQ